MAWNRAETEIDLGSAGSVIERSFELTCDGRVVPGVYWAPIGGGDRLVLLGHGGTTHKKAEYIEQVALALAAEGVATMAIDGPGHGDRPNAEPGLAESTAGDTSAFERAWRSGGGTEAIVTDWRAALDFVEAERGERPTGWWGLSMGTMMGLPVAATDERIRVALLGLMGAWGPAGDDLMRMAPDVECPVRFLVQWDDEIVPRQACLDLFDALGSRRKTLHANPGAHGAVPMFESISSVEYLTRSLR